MVALFRSANDALLQQARESLPQLRVVFVVTLNLQQQQQQQREVSQEELERCLRAKGKKMLIGWLAH